MTTVSVIATVLNEGETLRELMESLVRQTRQPDEIIIVDGGSRDNTFAILQSYCDKLPLRILVEPGCNISQGRNRAIAAARGEIIAATDAGLWLSPHWVEKLCEPLDADADLQMVGGFFEADARSLFEIAMGAAVSRLPDEINPATFLPGSRSIAYHKSAWAAVGGYPEWLDFGEDMVFVLNLRQFSRRMVFASTAIVYFRPRSTLRAFFKQYYHYAGGDGKADLWRNRHALRYATYFLLLPGIGLLGMIVHPLLWLLYGIGGALYLYQPYRRLAVALHKAQIRSSLAILFTIALLPLIRLVGDLGKMAGYPVGLYWRWRNQRLDWRYRGGAV